MTRISNARPKKLLTQLIFWFARRELGMVPTSIKISAHHKRVLCGQVAMEQAQAGATMLDSALKALVEIRVATLIGCPF